MLGQGYWQRAYGGVPMSWAAGSPSAACRTPSSASAPAGSALPEEVDIWAPLQTDTTLGRRNDFLQVIGRLAPGVTPESARVELATIARRLEAEYPASNRRLGRGARSGCRSGSWARSGRRCSCSSAPWHWSCSSRAPTSPTSCWSAVTSRERELALRAALGAGAAAPSAAARSRRACCWRWPAAPWARARGVGRQRAARARAGHVCRAAGESIDARALAFALVLSVATGLLFGVVPAHPGTRLRARGGLDEGGRALSGARSAARTAQRPGARGGRAGLGAAGRARR